MSFGCTNVAQKIGSQEIRSKNLGARKFGRVNDHKRNLPTIESHIWKELGVILKKLDFSNETKIENEMNFKLKERKFVLN